MTLSTYRIDGLSELVNVFNNNTKNVTKQVPTQCVLWTENEFHFVFVINRIDKTYNLNYECVLLSCMYIYFLLTQSVLNQIQTVSVRTLHVSTDIYIFFKLCFLLFFPSFVQHTCILQKSTTDMIHILMCVHSFTPTQ